jgi:hypothetical protein
MTIALLALTRIAFWTSQPKEKKNTPKKLSNP